MAVGGAGGGAHGHRAGRRRRAAGWVAGRRRRCVCARTPRALAADAGACCARPAEGARLFVVVDTNVLMSHIDSVTKTLEEYGAAATQARWGRGAAHCCCAAGWLGMSRLHPCCPHRSPPGPRGLLAAHDVAGALGVGGRVAVAGRAGALVPCSSPSLLMQRGGEACRGGAAAGALDCAVVSCLSLGMPRSACPAQPPAAPSPASTN